MSSDVWQTSLQPPATKLIKAIIMSSHIFFPINFSRLLTEMSGDCVFALGLD